MSSKEPWLNNWTKKKKLGGGGQGTTFLVTKNESRADGVLKILKYQKDNTARRRMYREVANLKVLRDAGCKVPAILDSNVDQFETKDTKLYFVMEYILGKSLSDVVKRTNGLSLEKSCALMIDLCETIRIAAVEEVIHRDLKPENIIVRSLKKNDTVIVDYGLSFNRKEPEDITQAGETLDNRFLSLPERRVPGGNRRDPRSDLTSVCGILYYCIMAEPPIDLLDANELPPHKRPGYSIADKIDDDSRTSQLVAFFDRGFATHIDLRFQTIDELLSRVNEILKPSARTTIENPLEIADKAKELFLKYDRKTQLATYRTNAQEILNALQKLCDSYFHKLSPFDVTRTSINTELISRADNTENIGMMSVYLVSVQYNQNAVFIIYEIRAKGSQCGVFRQILKRIQPDFSKLIPVGQLESIMWYDALTTPDSTIIVEDFQACLIDAMKIIQQDILS